MSMKQSKLIILLILTVVNVSRGQPKCQCCQSEFRQFDFWIGDWEVYNKEGNLIGTNQIKLMQDSCVLQENWQARQSSYSGTSYNFYNQLTGQWQQLWIDNQGQHLELSGNLQNNAMVLQGSIRKDRKGKEYINRISWTPLPEGHVHQHWEISYNEGENWKTIFEGEYRKKD